MKRALKNLVKQNLRRVFEVGQHAGLDILPRHFYSQVPDLRELRRSTDWRKPHSMRSVRGHELSEQLAFAERVCQREFIQAASDSQVYERACKENGEAGYGPVEAVFLYAFIRSQRPQRVVQVGCGVSTAVILQAAADAGYVCEVCCIDPFPTAYLERAAAAGRIQLLARPAQEVVVEQAARLKAGDLLFVDSTHTVKPGSEVNLIILDVLPNLAPEVWVHFHDITFPYDYTRRITSEDLFFPVESTLLHAFLSCNEHYAVAASLSMLHYSAPEKLAALLPQYQPAGNADGLLTSEGHFPSSTYLRVTR